MVSKKSLKVLTPIFVLVLSFYFIGCVTIEDADNSKNDGLGGLLFGSAQLGVESPWVLEKQKALRAKYSDANRLKGAGLSMDDAKLVFTIKPHSGEGFYTKSRPQCPYNVGIWAGDRELFRKNLNSLPEVVEFKVPAGLYELEVLFYLCYQGANLEGKAFEKLYLKPGETVYLDIFPVADWDSSRPQGYGTVRIMDAPLLAVVESN